MHRIYYWFAVIEPERCVVRMRGLVGWIITLSNAFDLSIDPRAVTRTVVCPSDQSPERSPVNRGVIVYRGSVVSEGTEFSPRGRNNGGSIARCHIHNHIITAVVAAL
jgi:hypothetical protein